MVRGCFPKIYTKITTYFVNASTHCLTVAYQNGLPTSSVIVYVTRGYVSMFMQRGRAESVTGEREKREKGDWGPEGREIGVQS